MKLKICLILFSGILLQACKIDDSNPSISLPNNFIQQFGGEEEDFFTSILSLNNSIYLLGSTLSKGNLNGDMYLVKTDLEGHKIWEKTFGLQGIERGNQLLIAPDGNLYLLGSTESIGNGRADIYLIKVNPDGDIIWENTYGTSAHEIPSTFLITSNNELCIAATQHMGDTAKIYLVWADLSGHFLRKKQFALGLKSGSDGIFEDNQQNLYIFGYREDSLPESRDFQLLKTNVNGKKKWAKTYGGSQYEESSTLLATPNGELLLFGHSASIDPHHNMFAVKVDTSGLVLWEKNYGEHSHDGGEGGIINSNGHYVFLGITNSNTENVESIAIITTDDRGVMINEQQVSNKIGLRGDDMIELNGFYYIACRIKTDPNGNNSAALVRRIK